MLITTAIDINCLIMANYESIIAHINSQAVCWCVHVLCVQMNANAPCQRPFLRIEKLSNDI